MRRVVMKTYRTEDLSLGTIDILRDLQKQKIISVVALGGLIGVARCHVNHGKDSTFRKMVKLAAKELSQ